VPGKSSLGFKVFQNVTAIFAGRVITIPLSIATSILLVRFLRLDQRVFGLGEIPNRCARPIAAIRAHVPDSPWGESKSLQQRGKVVQAPGWLQALRRHYPIAECRKEFLHRSLKHRDFSLP
jgi:hypothetical protein